MENSKLEAKYMNKSLYLYLMYAVLLALPCKAASLIEQEKALTVLISNEGFMGSGRGTGVLLDNKHVLTCAHMMQDPRDNLVIYTYPFGQVIRAHPLASDSSDDLLLLELDSSATIKMETQFQNETQSGESITIIGNTLGAMVWFVSKGVVSGEDHGAILTDALVNPGNSGGPWFNEVGQVVAITDWRIGPEEEHHVPGLAGGISSKTIQHFLQQYKQAVAMREFLEKMLQGGSNANVQAVP